MLQSFESNLFLFAAIFLFFGIFAIGWLVIHIEHGRHLSRLKVAFSGILGAIFFGFGIHFLLLSMGM
ncbi:hypothetical protein E4H12_02570 [Candidatus Thorarchaeota archaeon]|nr:MAG: hypothetical protein E4H12_02570 [Candidatus Thorarchaeota archaeon]